MIAFIPVLATATANKAITFLFLFVAQLLSWAGVPALGTAATGAAGALASQGTVHLWAVIVVGTIGAEVGSLVGWWLGNRGARAGLDGEGHASERRLKTLAASEKVADRWGRLIVFFVPSWVSGALGMRLGQFARWNLLAATLWNIGAALAAYGVASAIEGHSSLRIILPLAIGVAVLAAMFVMLRKVRRRRRDQRGGPADVVS